MIKQKRTVGLIAFLRGSSNPADMMPGCANFDHCYGGCLFRTAEGTPNNDLLEEEKSKCSCLVQQGLRCASFERAILPMAKDIGLQSVYSQYEKSIGIEGALKISIGSARLCPECGAGLKLRQRFCDSCSKRRRQKSYRKVRENQRLVRHS